MEYNNLLELLYLSLIHILPCHKRKAGRARRPGGIREALFPGPVSRGFHWRHCRRAGRGADGRNTAPFKTIQGRGGILPPQNIYSGAGAGADWPPAGCHRRQPGDGLCAPQVLREERRGLSLSLIHISMRRYAREGMKYADILKLGDDEAMFIMEQPDEESAGRSIQE